MSTDKGPVALPGERSLRTSDIATEVGVHANTVRLYEEWGYLPPIPRTEAGYRQFNSIHLAQMKLARFAFADPFPGRHIRRSLAALVRLAALGNYSGAYDAAHEHKALVVREIALAEAAADYLERWVAGEVEVEDQAPGILSGQAAGLLQITKDTLRHWERNGLINPPRDPQNGYRHYGTEEIGRLQVLRLLTRAGYSTMAVLRTVRSLDSGRFANLGELLDSPSEDEDVLYATDRWLTTLRIHEERSSLIASHIKVMITLIEPSNGI